jgi:hypothetical protein
MKNRKQIELFTIAIHTLTLASLFRLDPAVDELRQHIKRAAAFAQVHFVKLTDIKLIA